MSGTERVIAGAVALLAAAAGLWLGQAPSVPGSGMEPVDEPTFSAMSDAPGLTEEATQETTPEPGPLDGIVIVLDPGHNSDNAANPREINALVLDGRGGMKACNTVGTSTTDGYPEHAFTWDVADRTRLVLEDRGATVILTREESGVGPCVDVRGSAGQNNNADVLVSIHGDGSESATAQGFYAIVVGRPLNDAQGAPSQDLATDIVTALAGAGFSPSNIVADGAIQYRNDLATINHSEVPTVLLELAQFRNPVESQSVQDPDVRQRYAEALADGIEEWYTR